MKNSCTKESFTEANKMIVEWCHQGYKEAIPPAIIFAKVIGIVVLIFACLFAVAYVPIFALSYFDIEKGSTTANVILSVYLAVIVGGVIYASIVLHACRVTNIKKYFTEKYPGYMITFQKARVFPNYDKKFNVHYAVTDLGGINSIEINKDDL